MEVLLIGIGLDSNGGIFFQVIKVLTTCKGLIMKIWNFCNEV
jgi:hypothetical protein